MTTTPFEPMAYIATKECGCILAAMLKDAIDKKVLGKLIAEYVAAGHNIEFVTHSYVLENWAVCDHGAKQQPLPLQPKAEQNGSTPHGIEYTVATDGSTDLTPAQRSMRLMQAAQDGKVLTTDAPVQPDNGAFLFFRAYAESKGEGEGFIYTIEEMTQLSPTDEPEVSNTQTFDNQHVRFTTALGDIASLFQWDIEEPEATAAELTPEAIQGGTLQMLDEGYTLWFAGDVAHEVKRDPNTETPVYVLIEHAGLSLASEWVAPQYLGYVEVMSAMVAIAPLSEWQVVPEAQPVTE